VEEKKLFIPVCCDENENMDKKYFNTLRQNKEHRHGNNGNYSYFADEKHLC
jgi:hypothetical protein